MGLEERGSQQTLTGYSENPKSTESIWVIYQDKKKTKLNFFVAQNGLFATPFVTPKIPGKSLSGSLLVRSFPGNEAHRLFPVPPTWGILGGGQRVYVENVDVLSLSL